MSGYHAAKKSCAIMAVNLGDKAGHHRKADGNGYQYGNKPVQVQNSVFNYRVHIDYLQILCFLNSEFTNQLFSLSVSREPLNP
jgi:hypothetical protein